MTTPRIGPTPRPGELPEPRQLLRAVGMAIALAAVLLLTVILPAEYGIDVTGAGRALGLARLHGAAARQGGIVLGDAIGGNEKLDATKIVAAGEPLPLPNPAVHQPAATAPATRVVTVHLPVGGETEVKAVMRANQVLLYSWHTDGDPVYVDFHGHSPEWVNKEAFVRYLESKDGLKEEHGSLVAPFAGEHGWYWVNLTDRPLTITLTVSGYYDDIRDYGVH
jgi:hypothetical protein